MLWCVFVFVSDRRFISASGFSFSLNGAARSFHRAISNTDEKLRPHECDRCGKSFAQKSVVLAHVKAVRKYCVARTRNTSRALLSA